ncbi:hypothetical protein MMC28_004439 [Mycoblastus sanguinarius]|nr:hypothetical protein [Mycoblastus sanguinarius]
MERHLPVELCEQICIHCDFATLKNLRTVNNVFRDVCAQSLFQKVYFACLPDSVSNLNHISKHPVLRFHVKTIVVLTNLLSSKYPRDTNYSKDTGLELGGIPAEQERIDGLIYHYESFKKLRKEQEMMRDDETDFQALSLAVSLCPNLQTMKTYEHQPRTQYPYDNAESTPILIVSRLRKATLLPYPFHQHECLFDLGDWSLFPSITRSIIGLGKAIGQPEASCCLQELEIDAIPWCRSRNGLEISRLPEDQDLWLSAFRSIRVMKLHFWSSGLRLGIHYPPLREQTVSFLQAAAHLTVLHLDFQRKYDDQIIRPRNWLFLAVDLSEGLSEVTWPELTELKLSRCGFTSRAFTDLMQRHTSHLKSFEAYLLALKGIGIGWRDSFEDLAPVMSLHHVRFEMLVDLEIKKHIDNSDDFEEYDGDKKDDEGEEKEGEEGNEEEENGGDKGNEEDFDTELSKFRLEEGPTVRKMWETYDRGVSRYFETKGRAQYPIWGESVESLTE